MVRPAFALIVLALSIGCSGPTGPSDTTPLSERIAGVWTLVDQRLPGEAAVPPPGASRFTFQVIDGRAAVRADCNQCGGSAIVRTATVTVGPTMACTRAFCTISAPYDTTYVQILSGDNLASIDGDTLMLRSERGTLRFRR